MSIAKQQINSSHHRNMRLKDDSSSVANVYGSHQEASLFVSLIIVIKINNANKKKYFDAFISYLVKTSLTSYSLKNRKLKSRI